MESPPTCSERPSRVRPAALASGSRQQACRPLQAQAPVLLGSVQDAPALQLLGNQLLRRVAASLLDGRGQERAALPLATAAEEARCGCGGGGEDRPKPQEAHGRAAGRGGLLLPQLRLRHDVGVERVHGVGEPLGLLGVGPLLVVDAAVKVHGLLRPRLLADAGRRLDCHALVKVLLQLVKAGEAGAAVGAAVLVLVASVSLLGFTARGCGSAPGIPPILPRLAGGGNAVRGPGLPPEGTRSLLAELRRKACAAEGRQLDVAPALAGDVAQHALAGGVGAGELVRRGRGCQGDGARELPGCHHRCRRGSAAAVRVASGRGCKPS
mmetsp:Transcript_95788/g.295536  ORF Transcript_95788/g.295536 Transcript_95788/m.295536 type:complete len:324 (+) Transcript_95788:270-1241(+)